MGLNGTPRASTCPLNPINSVVIAERDGEVDEFHVLTPLEVVESKSEKLKGKSDV